MAALLFGLAPWVGCHVHTRIAAAAREQDAALVDAGLQRRAEDLGRAVVGCGEALAALRDLFAASEQVTAAEFWLFAERARQRHPGMLAIAWAPARAVAAACGGPPVLAPVVHVTPPAAGRFLDLGGPEVHDARHCALARALATDEVVLGEACVVPPERTGRAVAELWLKTGEARLPPTDDGHSGLLLAIVDLDELLAAGAAGAPACELFAARGRAPPGRSLPVLAGLWSLHAPAVGPAGSSLSSTGARWWGTAAGVGWALFSSLLLLAGWAFRREGQRHQSRLIGRVLASLTEGVVVADRAGRLIACNDAAVRLLTPPPADGDVRRWFANARLVDPASRAPDPPRSSVLARSLAGHPVEEVVRMPAAGIAAEARWVAITGHALRSGPGTSAGAVVVVRDVTARHQQAERLERLSRAVEQTADMVMITGRDGCVIYVNPAFTALTGHAREDVVGRADFLRQSGFYGADDLARLRRTVLRGERCRGAISCRRKDGSMFATEQTITPLLDDAGRVTHVVVVCKDMTTHNQLLANEVELQIAATVQRRLFPRVVPVVPGLDVAGATMPARTTSGDIYDWVVRPGGALALVIGDASGHGLGPALLVSEVHAFLRCLLAMPLSLVQVLGRVHELLAPDLPDGGFVTLLLVEIDPTTRRLRWANAGHEPGLLLPARGEPTRLAPTGPALGVLDAAPVYALADGPPIAAGDLLVLATDGLTEHELPAGGRLGEAGLRARVAEVADRSAAAIVAHLEQGLREPVGESERDDATVVVVRGVRRG